MAHTVGRHEQAVEHHDQTVEHHEQKEPRMRITDTDGTQQGLRNLAPEIVDAAHGFAGAIYQHTSLPLRLFEAARIETALINGCMICMNWQSARDSTNLGPDGGVTANGPAPDQAFYDTVLARRTDGLDEREIAAIEYARGMGTNPQGLSGDEELWSRMKTLFSDPEIVELTYCIAGWMGLGRVAHVLGTDQACEVPAAAEGQFEITQSIRAGNPVQL
ncbi:carboxymuconolactone decarboxylase family protein [Enemella sp. A6]|uniref:carboxymuconolactone decarboxylase family protein n=1 Tax=Enemella sp. A6 TaxID=3440152 RepID=UPI003EBEB508